MMICIALLSLVAAIGIGCHAEGDVHGTSGTIAPSGK
jgi:hypothetical protein